MNKISHQVRINIDSIIIGLYGLNDYDLIIIDSLLSLNTWWLMVCHYFKITKYLFHYAFIIMLSLYFYVTNFSGQGQKAVILSQTPVIQRFYSLCTSVSAIDCYVTGARLKITAVCPQPIFATMQWVKLMSKHIYSRSV